MPALVDRRLCDSSPYCAATRSCPKGVMTFDRTNNRVVIKAELCGDCAGFCARVCPMKAVRFARTMAELKAIEAEIEDGPSAEALFEQQFGVKPVDPRAEGINLVHADEASFQKYVLDSPIPVAVDFWAGWCAPCKILAPTFKELAAEFEGKVRFVKVDTEANEVLADRYNVRSIPTIIFYMNGKIVDRSIGAAPKGQIRSHIENILRTQEVSRV